MCGSTRRGFRTRSCVRDEALLTLVRRGASIEGTRLASLSFPATPKAGACSVPADETGNEP